MFSLIASLASTYGWSERYCLYDLPFSRAIGYLHCIELGSLTHWTVDPFASASNSADGSVSGAVISEERLREIFAEDEF